MTEEANLLGLINEASKSMDISDLDSFLSTLSKYERLLDKFMAIYSRLDRSGVITVILRVIGKKTDIDVDKPITNPLNVVAKTATHKALFEMLNEVGEADIRAIHEQIILAKAQLEKGAKDEIRTENNRNNRSEAER